MPGSSGATGGRGHAGCILPQEAGGRGPGGHRKSLGAPQRPVSCQGEVGGAVSLPRAVQGGATSLPTPPRWALCKAAPQASQSQCLEPVANTKTGLPRCLPTCCPPPCPAHQATLQVLETEAQAPPLVCPLLLALSATTFVPEVLNPECTLEAARELLHPASGFPLLLG